MIRIVAMALMLASAVYGQEIVRDLGVRLVGDSDIRGRFEISVIGASGGWASVGAELGPTALIGTRDRDRWSVMAGAGVGSRNIAVGARVELDGEAAAPYPSRVTPNVFVFVRVSTKK